MIRLFRRAVVCALCGVRLARPKCQRRVGSVMTKVDTQGGAMSDVSLMVNGKRVGGAVEDRTLLVHFLRENLGLTGTHVGCDTSQCGACVVHVDGKAVKSCTMLAAQASGSSVVTIEGLANGADLHPVQAAFKEHHGLQCGFCTPGMIMAATDMINRHPEGLDEATVRAELEGNICRCTGYHNIVKAILAASTTMSKGARGKAKQAA
ncbi:aerobic carbon-monoxide dehydrogenase small subunit [Mesorhizobium sp. URHB0026]